MKKVFLSFYILSFSLTAFGAVWDDCDPDSIGYASSENVYTFLAGLQDKFFKDCEKGNLDEIKGVLADYEENVDITKKDPEGRTALCIACQHDQEELVAFFFREKFFDFTKTIRAIQWDLVLHVTYQKDDLEAVKKIFAHQEVAPVIYSTNDHFQLLAIAVNGRENYKKIVKFLISPSFFLSHFVHIGYQSVGSDDDFPFPEDKKAILEMHQWLDQAQEDRIALIQRYAHKFTFLTVALANVILNFLVKKGIA